MSPSAIIPEGVVRVATRLASGAWEAPVTLGASEGGVDVAMGPDGLATAAWSPASAEGDAPQVVIARTDASGAWSAPAAVAPGSVPRIAVGAGRAIVAAWAGPALVPHGTTPLRAAVSHGAAWTPPATLGALVLYPDRVPLRFEGTTSAASYDRVPRPAVTADARGTWLARRRAVRWTVTVRNRGPVVARGVRPKVSVCCGNPVVAWPLAVLG